MARHALVCSAHVLVTVTVMTLNSFLVVALRCVSGACYDGKKHAEKVALRRYLHNIKLKIMLNVYELLFDILI